MNGDNHDTFSELHNDDRLWAYVIRVSESWRNRDSDRWNDSVMSCLFRMMFDWEGDDRRSGPSIQSMRYSLVLASRVWDRLLVQEELVSL